MMPLIVNEVLVSFDLTDVGELLIK
jgi:hypothetical protein